MNIFKKLTKITLFVAILSLSFFPQIGSSSFVAEAATPSAKDAVCDSIGCDTDDDGSITNIIGTILNILSIIAGVAAVIMIILAGLKFITSQGDASAVSSARNTVLYALIGVVIVVLSQLIVRFVFTTATTPADQPSNSQLPLNTI